KLQILTLLIFFICGFYILVLFFFFFSSRRRHTRYWRDWSSDVCSSDLHDARRHALPFQRGTHQRPLVHSDRLVPPERRPVRPRRPQGPSNPHAPCSAAGAPRRLPARPGFDLAGGLRGPPPPADRGALLLR